MSNFSYFIIKKSHFYLCTLFSLFFNFSSFANEHEQENFSFDANKINRIEINVDNSNINIHSSISETSEVGFRRIRYGSDPIFNIGLDESTLKIEAHKRNGDTIDFETSFDLSIPRNSSMKIIMGGGNLSVTDCDGELNLSGGTIKADINSSLSKMDARIGVGRLDIQGLFGDFKLNMGDGNLNIRYMQLFDVTKRINLNMGKGNVSIFLPNHSLVHTQNNSRVTSEFQNSPVGISNFFINANITSGGCYIKKNDD